MSNVTDAYLDYIQEQFIDDTRHKIKIQYGKIGSEDFIYFDIPKPKGIMKKFARWVNHMPQIWVFKSFKDLQKKNGKSPGRIYIRKHATNMLKKGNIKGTGVASYSPHLPMANLILRKIDASILPKSTNLVARYDSWGTGITSSRGGEIIVTSEPMRTWYLKAKESEINEQGSFSAQMLLVFCISIAAIFAMTALHALTSKRVKSLEKKLKDILKDGKNWKVYKTPSFIPNAYCIATPRVFLSAGLIGMMSEEEVLAVCLHEAGHINNRDIFKNLIVTTGTRGLVTAVASTLAKTKNDKILVFLLPLFYIMVTSGYDVKLTRRVIGRRMEYNADSFAVKYGHGEHMKNALLKLDKWITNEYSKRPCGKICKAVRYVSHVMDEHPPIEKRVESVINSEKELNTIARLKTPGKIKAYFMEKFGAV